jgi:hypothetical protein
LNLRSYVCSLFVDCNTARAPESMFFIKIFRHFTNLKYQKTLSWFLRSHRQCSCVGKKKFITSTPFFDDIGGKSVRFLLKGAEKLEWMWQAENKINNLHFLADKDKNEKKPCFPRNLPWLADSGIKFSRINFVSVH